jgi:hypothetical protein
MLKNITINIDLDDRQEKVSKAYYIKQYGNLQLVFPSYLVPFDELEFPAYDVIFDVVNDNGVRKLKFDYIDGWKTFLILVDKDVTLWVDLDGWVTLNADDEKLPMFSLRYVRVARVEVEDKKGFFVATRLDKIEVEEFNEKKHQFNRYVLR